MTIKKIVCIASGPSLTEKDCTLVENLGLPTLAVNDSWERARFCNYIYASDYKWWDSKGHKIDIDAEKWTSSKPAAKLFKLNFHRASGPFNSGMRALQWSIEQGFNHIILIGYDCSLKYGIHWHGRHEGLSNPTSTKVKKWHLQFLNVSMTAKKRKVKIVNCSRYTELGCFVRSNLEDELCVV